MLVLPLGLKDVFNAGESLLLLLFSLLQYLTVRKQFSILRISSPVTT